MLDGTKFLEIQQHNGMTFTKMETHVLPIKHSFYVLR